MTEIAISAHGLGKRYRRGLRVTKHDQIRDAIKDSIGALLRRNAPPKDSELFWALRDASFEVRKGENVGIIGLNGAGKSTLLKILSRITTPTAGRARIVGRLGALLEVGTGFHQELTGRENVFLYGAILGMGRAEVARKFDAIVDFSEIADFIDTPVKRYSSGMYVRLAFAVAAHLDPDILLLDEVLAVGDFTFQRKCMDFAHRLEQSGATILFVSHNMHSIKSMCQRVIYLKGGRVTYDGPTDGGLRLYEQDCRLAPSPWFQPEDGPPEVTISDVSLHNEGGDEKTVFDYGGRMRVRIRYDAARPIDGMHLLVGFTRADGVLCSVFSTVADGLTIPSSMGVGEIELLTPALELVSDTYMVSVTVRERSFHKVLCAQMGCTFHMRHPVFVPDAFGVFHQKGVWSSRQT